MQKEVPTITLPRKISFELYKGGVVKNEKIEYVTIPITAETIGPLLRLYGFDIETGKRLVWNEDFYDDDGDLIENYPRRYVSKEERAEILKKHYELKKQKELKNERKI